MQRATHRAEVAVALVTIAISALFLWDARRYAPSPFEPIGSGAVPSGVAAGALVLGLIMLWHAGKGLRATAGEAAAVELGPRVLATFLLTIAYVVLLATGWVRYAFATAPFFVLGVLVIAEQPRRLLPWAVAIALILAFALDFTFRRIFVVDIP
ncbi:MAG: tripartite tricarboxylate transporter TctB family protein [Beijerinckiaceae bacterium]